MSVKKSKNAFLSFSHEDVDFAKKIAGELRASGIDISIDEWELMPGDSLIGKIFEDIIPKCDVFLYYYHAQVLNPNG